MKGVSLAIFGFMTLAVAVAAIVWVQYNSYGGIRGKTSSTEDFSLLRLNEEYMKSMAFLERTLAIAGKSSVRDISVSGGECEGNDTRFWICDSLNIPTEDDIISCIGDKSEEYFNSQAEAISTNEDSILINADKATNFSVSRDYSGIITLKAGGAKVRAANRNAYMESDSEGMEWSTEDGRILEDYETIKRWSEEEIAQIEMTGAISDDRFIVRRMTDVSCGCGTFTCPKPSESFGNVFPCFGDRIESAVRDALERATDDLSNDERFFSGKVSCSIDIECVAINKPIFTDVERNYFEPGVCCGECLTECRKDEAPHVTPSVCSDVAGERECERPECANGDYEYYQADDEDYYGHSDGMCQNCCEVVSKVNYEAEATFAVSCVDERGIEPIVWNAKFFVSARSS